MIKSESIGEAGEDFQTITDFLPYTNVENDNDFYQENKTKQKKIQS